MHFTDELNNIVGVGVMVEKLAVQVKPLGPRRSHQRRQGGNPIVPSPGVLNWGLAASCPNATTKGLEHVPTFIEKNQASTAFSPLFLSAAKCGCANARSQLRPVREPAASVIGRSIRVDAGVCRHSRRGIARQTVAQSSPGQGHTSNPSERSPKPPAPDPRPRPNAVVDPPPIVAEDQDAACESIREPRHVSSASAIDWLMTHLSPPPRPLPSTISPARKAGPQSSDALPALRDFLLVSFPQT